MSDNPLDLNQIISMIRAGEKEEARARLLQVLQQDPKNEQAWFAMAACARNRAEYGQCIQQTLTLNPRHAQALELAKQHKIDLPKAAKKGRKKPPKVRQQSSGGNRLRVLLLLLLIVVLIGAGALLLLTGDDADDATTQEAAATADATEAPEATADATQEATADVTQEATADATPDPTEVVAAPSPTLDAAALTEFPVLPDPSGYIQSIEVLAGDDPAALEDRPFYAPEDSLNAVINLSDRGEGFTLTLRVSSLERSSISSDTYEQAIPAGAAEQFVIPLQPAGEVWLPSLWAISPRADDTSLPDVEFAVVGEVTTDAAVATAAPDVVEATPAATNNAPVPPPPGTGLAPPVPRPANTANVPLPPVPSGNQATTPTAQSSAPSPTPTTRARGATTPEAALPGQDGPPTLRMGYDGQRAYLLNISDATLNVSTLRFEQTLEDGEVIGYPASNWSVGNPARFTPGSCFQVGLDRAAAASPASECLRLSAWQIAPLEEQFWLINDSDVRTFQVVRGETPIAQCDIDASECAFNVGE